MNLMTLSNICSKISATQNENLFFFSQFQREPLLFFTISKKQENKKNFKR